MPVLIPSDHIIEDGIHVLPQQILIVILKVEGLLIRRPCLLRMLLYLKLDFQVLFLRLVPAVFADSRGQTVHPLQLSCLLVAAPLEIAVEVGLQ